MTNFVLGLGACVLFYVFLRERGRRRAVRLSLGRAQVLQHFVDALVAQGISRAAAQVIYDTLLEEMPHTFPPEITDSLGDLGYVGEDILDLVGRILERMDGLAPSELGLKAESSLADLAREVQLIADSRL